MRRPRPFLTHLEAVRLQRHLTQDELAQKARVDQRFISMLERGDAMPTEDQAIRISRALGLDPDLLMQPVPPVRLSKQAAS